MNSAYFGIAILVLLGSITYFTRATEQWEPEITCPAVEIGCTPRGGPCWYVDEPHRIYVEKM